jgi:hypothetical protein
MNRRFLVVALAVGLPLAALIASHIASTPAQPPVALPSKAAKTPGSPLPIGQVVLFSSGVGYFQREGEIDGDARIDLTFPATDINDLLKSLVLQDAGGGRIGAIGYDSPDPVEKTLRAFSVDLTGNPTFGEILNQARGQKIELTLQQSSATQPANLTGIIVGMEALASPGEKEPHLLNLMCAEGMRSVPLAQVQRVRFLDPAIENDFRRALEILANAHDMGKKAVTLRFNGDARRTVRVGYVIENPIWKTSYRLVIAKDAKIHLQGWAAVENTTDEDWKDVRMALVCGRPISFQTDLYSPIFVPRPTVEMERFASLRPPEYSGPIFNSGANLGVGGGAIGGLGIGGLPAFGLGGGLGVLGFGGGGLGNAGNLGVFGGGLNRYQSGRFNSLSGRQDDDGNRLSWEQLQRRREQLKEAKEEARKVGGAITGLDATEGVRSVASAVDIGDSYQYQLDEKVTLNRQKSALLPILNEEVKAERVSIYNDAVQAKFPLLGLRFKNTTNESLTQGPITVFEGGSYAGDARISDLQPGEERLIAYAVDLGTEVKAEVEHRPAQLIAAKIVKGLLHTTLRSCDAKMYVVKNRSKQDRALVIEHPVRPAWKLAAVTKPREISRDFYRFQLSVGEGQTARQEVVEEMSENSVRLLTDLGDKEILSLMDQNVVSRDVKDAFFRFLELRQVKDDAKSAVAETEGQLRALTEDQARLRANLKETPSTAAAYKRYLDKLDKQESEIEQLQERVKELTKTAGQRAKAYDEFVRALTVE